MSAPKHAKPTLVRLFNNGERVANILVDDWEDGDGHAIFTIPVAHPRARWLLDSAPGDSVSILVLSSDVDVEWMLESVTTGAIRDDIYDTSYYRVVLISRRRRILVSQPDDNYCIKVFGVEVCGG